MTVLEGNQAYRAAMQLLWIARVETQTEYNDVAYQLICRVQHRLTEQENKDMQASFADR
jgi:hypothetical protein